MDRVELWSSGGGVQSNTIGAMIYMGKLKKPDLAAIVDTGRELSTTWDYFDNVTKPALESVGVDFIRIDKDAFATVDLFGGEKGDSLLIPAFTDKNGDIGKMPTFCSNEWKTRVVRRWADLQRRNSKFNVWIGFTTDEMDRMKFNQKPNTKWRDVYPLIDLRMARYDCYKIIQEAGWPEPPRSSCWMCPNKPTSEWVWQKENAPEDFQKAIDFEQEIRVIDPHVWLTQEGKPLSECDFDAQQDIWAGGGCEGHCFV